MFIPYLRHTLPDCSDTTTSLWICILITFLGHTPSPLHTLMFLFKMYFYHFSCTYSIRKSNLHIFYLKMYFYPFSWHIPSPSLTKTFSCFFIPFLRHISTEFEFFDVRVNPYLAQVNSWAYSRVNPNLSQVGLFSGQLGLIIYLYEYVHTQILHLF